MTTSWHSYPKVYALGHAAVQHIMLDPVLVEEKVDGSQFSFGKFTDDAGNEFLRIRSKGAEMNLDAPERMFERAATMVKEIAPLLTPGWTYRGEYLTRPKHNVLCYDRTPARHFILFDVNTGQEMYLTRAEKEAEAARLGLEIVPVLHFGMVESLDFFRSFLERESILGGQKVEGVVVKNYTRFGIDGKAMLGKFVSEAFKEVHAAEWKKSNPKQGDIVQMMIDKYRTPARWSKAVQRLAESGQLAGEPRDIGNIIKSARADILEECGEEIRDELMKWGWPKIERGVVGGIAEWYKEELLQRQFDTEFRHA